MRAGLLAKECIDAPTAIDPDFDAQLFKGGTAECTGKQVVLDWRLL